MRVGEGDREGAGERVRVGLGLTVGQAEAHGVDEHESVEAPVLQLRRERLVLPGGGARGLERGAAGARQPAIARGRTAADPLPHSRSARDAVARPEAQS